MKDIVSVACNSPFEGDLLRRFASARLNREFAGAMLCRLARIVAAHDWLAKLPLQKTAMTPRPSIPLASSLPTAAREDRQEYCWLLFDHRVRIKSAPRRIHWLHRDGGVA